MKKFLSAVAVCLSFGSAAAAATLSIDGGTAGVIPGGSLTNEFLNAAVATEAGFTNPNPGTYGSEISYSAGSFGSVKVDVYGFEAGYFNTFDFGGTSYTSTGGNVMAANLASPLASWVVAITSNGLLDFTFSTTGGLPNVTNPVVNNGDDNFNLAGNSNFFATEDADGAIWLFFDDAGGADDDDNHDDLVVRLSAVPLPAGALLLLSGLGIMGLRRKLAS